MNEVRIPGHQYEGVDVGVGVSNFDTVGGHLDVDAVFNSSSPHAVGVVGTGRRGPSGHKYWLNASGIKGGRVVQELAGASKFGSPGDPVGIGLSNDNAPVVRDFFF